MLPSSETPFAVCRPLDSREYGPLTSNYWLTHQMALQQLRLGQARAKSPELHLDLSQGW